MEEQAPDQRELQEKRLPETRIAIPEWPAFGYHRDEIYETRGMQVAWRIRIARGAEAADLEDRLNTAIWELLQWAHRHPPR
jgi:hypothetical protein